jgi:hypothetical protein
MCKVDAILRVLCLLQAEGSAELAKSNLVVVLSRGIRLPCQDWLLEASTICPRPTLPHTSKHEAGDRNRVIIAFLQPAVARHEQPTHPKLPRVLNLDLI